MTDVFISYAHADDEVPTGTAKGWVTTLADELKKVLRRKIGGAGASVFMDHQLVANQSHNDILLRELRESRVLVVAMSAGYEASFWCRRELGNFVANARARSATENVFIIEIEPDVSRRWWDPSLRYVNTIPFWRREFEDSAPRLLGYPVPNPDEHNPYWTKLNELAHGIAQHLRRAADAPTSARTTLLLAETTEDLLDERDAVAAFLSQQGVHVLPAMPYPRESEAAFLDAVTHDLASANIFAQLLGPREGRRPADGDTSFVLLQAAVARRAHAQARLRIVQWRAPDVNAELIAAPPYRALVTGIPAGRLEEFKREVAEALARPLVAEPVVPAASKSSAVDDLCVYVNADDVDRSVADWVGQALSPLGVTALIAPEPERRQTPEDIRRAQQEQLEGCDGVLLVYGQTPDTWLQSQFAVARRVVGLRRRGIWAAVLDAAPVSRSAPPIRSQSMISLNCRDGLDAGAIARFVAELRNGHAPVYA